MDSSNLSILKLSVVLVITVTFQLSKPLKNPSIIYHLRLMRFVKNCYLGIFVLNFCQRVFLFEKITWKINTKSQKNIEGQTFLYNLKLPFLVWKWEKDIFFSFTQLWVESWYNIFPNWTKWGRNWLVKNIGCQLPKSDRVSKRKWDTQTGMHKFTRMTILLVM